MHDDRMRDLLKKVSLELQQSRRDLAAMEHHRREPVAIVGIGCRFPGGADDPDAFWELLARERDAIGAFPTDRGWDLATLFDEQRGPGTSATRQGGFLGDIAGFDAGLFGMSPREATAADPQHRLLLETTWQAVEHAGLDPEGLRGTRTGVFVGTNGNDYPATLSGYPPELEGYIAVGNAASVASGRIAYSFGLEGPALTVDTACSSSLVAVHLALRALRERECDRAVVAGVTVMSSPTLFVEFSRQHGLSADGRCKAFGDGADGTGWAEGVGVLVVERLSDAVANGSRILAVLRGSAVNQDGASNGLTAPNGPAQQRVIEDALAAAGLRAAQVDAVEAHGTGTVLGDPIEAHALMATYGRQREGEPLWLGSVKANIGHTQAAAGMAGLIKMILALRHERLPRTLHADTPSSKIDWDAGDIRLLDAARAWPRGASPRRAGISAFGVSGTNAHVIVEEAPLAEAQPLPADPNPDDAGATAWLLSAHSPAALAGQASRLHAATTDADPVAAVTAALRRRTAGEHRAVVVGADAESLRRGLAALADGDDADGLVRGTVAPGRRTVFVFPGQGSQWAGMAAALSGTSPEFARFLTECADALAPFVDWSPHDVLAESPGAPGLDRVDVVQPVLWAMMVSLAKLWIHLGVRPDAVIGHSQGEIAAAHIAGALDLADAARVVALRSRALTAIAGRGAMLTVALSESRARARLAGRERELAVAAVNGPATALISGDSAAVDALAAELDRDGVWNRRVNVDYASHSPHVDGLEETLREQLAPVTARTGTVPVLSTVTGAPIDTAVMTAEYWFRNLRAPVLFEPALRHALSTGIDTAVEIGPHPVLRHTIEAIAEAAEHPDFAVTGTLRRDRPGRDELLAAAGRLHVRGVAVDWAALLPARSPGWFELPTYAFDRKRYWGADDAVPDAVDARRLGVGAAGHPLLGGTVEISASGATLFVATIGTAEHPWLADHAVRGTVVVPGAACVDIALWAGAHSGSPTLVELVNERPITVPESGRIALQVHLAPERDGHRAITFFTAEDEHPREWRQCVTGLLGPADGAVAPPAGLEPPADADPAEIYRALGALGLGYGPAFQGLRAVEESGGSIRATAVLPEAAGPPGAFALHPALLDSVLHAIPHRTGELALPFSWSGVRLWAAAADRLAIRATPIGDHAYRVVGVDPAGAPVLSIDSVTLRPAATEPVEAADDATPVPHRLTWTPLPATEPGEPPTAEVWATDPAAEPPAAAYVLLDTTEFTDAAAELADAELPAVVHAVAERTLGRVRSWLADGDPGARLVVLTRQAHAVLDGDVPALANGAVAGLVRSAQTEHPGRIVLLDHDGSAGLEALAAAAAAAVAADESEVALRAGALSVPRLAPATDPGDDEPPTAPRSGTALVVGGLGLLGGLTVRTLIEATEVAAVVVLTRRELPADELRRARAELGTGEVPVEIVTCDAADRPRLAAVLAAIPVERPLTRVVHAAGVLADHPVHALPPEALHEVLRAKVDIAWNLHELTRALELRSFTLFSSAAGVLGIAGQANYAAANTFLDALAGHRRASGLPAAALAWGLWATASSLTGHLGVTDHRRLAGQGVRALRPAEGAALLDRCLRAGAEDAVPVGLVRAPWQDTMSPTLRGVLRYRPRLRRAATADRAPGLAALPERDRLAAVLAIVREHAAAVLGYDSAGAVGESATFKELGMDSLTAVELRNRLARAAGTRLAATIVFEHPTPRALAGRIAAELGGSAPTGQRRARTAAVTDEPIAIVGMGCRYPGGVRSPAQLWRLVADRVDAITGWPDDRGWEVDGARSETAVRAGGFLAGMADFDAGLFGMSPREALATDPQQRQLLEVAWETLEDAGIDPVSLRGSDTGVYTGVMYNDYATRLASTPEDLEAYLINGSAASVASGRVAYTYGWEGPAISVDTACSSSLVAIHLAVAALRAGETDLALAGGVTLLSSPASMLSAARLGALSPDGRCRSFGEGADGTGWAEGVGLVLLQRLSDARKAGREVLAVIRSSAVNQDGASNGLTAPNGAAQRRVIERALAAAGLASGEVDAVEAHGTGTALGDPIEATALLETYGRDRGGHPLYIGSLKSNIGHSQAAAGVGGVIKMVQAIRHGVLPASLHAEVPSEHVEWGSGAVRVLSEPVAWPETGRVRRAGVSAFGVSGTNAHVIVEQAPPVAAPEEPAERSGRDTAWLLSGASEPALRRQAEQLAAHLRAHAELDIRGAATALVSGRARLGHRAVVLGDSADDLATGLDAIAAGLPAAAAVSGQARPRHRVTFVYPGHGSQWAGMAVELLESSPVFADAVADSAAALAPHLDWDVLAYLRSGGQRPPGRANVEFDQPALWAVMMGLTALWASVGVRPDLVIGHSQGEVAAACAAGYLSTAEGARIVAVRSRLLARLAGRGAMASLALPRERAEQLLNELDGAGGVAIATVNGTDAVVVSGDADGIDVVLAACHAAEIRARRLDAELAGHSPVIEAVAAELAAELGTVEQGPGTVRMISTVTAAPVRDGDLDAAHWYRNLRETVRFHAATIAAIEDGSDVFVEVSPHPVLTGPLAETIGNITDLDALAVGTLRRDDGGRTRFLLSAAELEVGGVPVAWPGTGTAAPRAQLPTYPFERRRYWLDGASALPALGAATGQADNHEVPGTTGDDLAALPAAERLSAVRELVRAQVHAVLRWDAADELDFDTALKELGFESVSAVDLTKRLGARTGLRLPTTLAFEYPTLAAITGHIAEELGRRAAAELPLLIDRLEAGLRAGRAEEHTLARLRALLAETAGTPAAPGTPADLDQASDDELFDIVDAGRNS